MTSVDTKEKSEKKDTISVEQKKTSKPYESPKFNIFEFNNKDLLSASGYGNTDDRYDNVRGDIFNY